MNGIAGGTGEKPPFLPRLIERSSRTWYRNTADYGLDTLLDSIFGKLTQDIFTHHKTARAVANEIVLRPETYADAIKSRQEVLGFFMENPQLYHLVVENGVKSPSIVSADWNRIYKGMKDCIESYRDLIHSLNATFRVSDNEEIKTFHKGIQELKEWDSFKELEQLIEDLDSPGTLTMDVTLHPDNLGHDGFLSGGINSWFTSATGDWTQKTEDKGRQFYTNDGRVVRIMDGLRIHLAYLGLLDKNGKLKQQLDITLRYEQTSTENIVVDIEYKKTRFLRTAIAERSRCYIGRDYFSENKHGKNFELAIENAKNQQLKDNFHRLHERLIEPFHETLAELKYFAILAKYFTEQKEKGAQVAFPDIEDKETNMTCLTNMVNPRAKVLKPSDIDNYGDSNLNVICGPLDCGETEYLGGIALAQAMMQAGWKVFAKEAVMSPKDNIVARFFTKRRRGDDELKRMRNLIETATPYTLILLDQPFASAHPNDGEEWTENVVKVLGALGATSYVATQFEGALRFANAAPYGQIFHTQRDESGKPAYDITEGIVHFCRDEDAELTATTKEQLMRILEYRQDQGEIRLRQVNPVEVEVKE